MRTAAVLRELPRKIFHVLSLLYYLLYWIEGLHRAVLWIGAWAMAVTAFEISRLYIPSINRLMLWMFSSVARPEEKRRISGLFHTTWGTLLMLLVFGKNPEVVAFALGCAALGDAAAALGGKALGRHKIGPGKTLEGSLSCLGVCFIIGAALGFGWAPSLLAAAAATVVEFAPTTAYFNDNLWMPLVAAGVLHLTLGK